MDTTNALWIMVSAALVLFMVPGLALFYGGMSRSKNMLNMLMMNMVCLGIVPVVWVTLGFTLSSAESGSNWIGDFDHAFLANVSQFGDVEGTASLLGIMFAMTFAIITPALIAGAVADRMKFSAWLVFVPVWLLLVFVPAWAWVFRGENGFLSARGSLDFAGGTVVHVAAGASALALVMVLGKRTGWPSEPMPPHNLPFTMLGAGILWFGWFGFNAGSAFEVNAVAVQALANTFMAAAVAMLAWLAVEQILDGHMTSLGAASGIVAGLVGITPGAGFMGTWGAMIVGLFAGVLCALAVRLKYRSGYDDALDVVGVHMVGGLVGGILIGFLADSGVFGERNGEADGVFADGGTSLLVEQIFANVFVLVFAFVVTYAIAWVLNATIGLRVSAEDEQAGLDTTMHAEKAYQ